MAGNGNSELRDKLRLCPSCRMEISFLATKCRFCGEPVGRPREEARQLTIQDLGGAQSGTDCVPSGEVLDALEAFRVEEIERNAAPAEPVKRGWFGAKKTSPARTVRKGTKPVAASQTTTLLRKVVVFAGVVAGVVLLYFIGTAAKTRISEYLNEKNTVPTVPVENKAEEILRAGGADATLKALEEAVKVCQIQNTPANVQVADRIRAALTRDVEELLGGTNWTTTDIDKASALVNRAAALDPESQVVLDLLTEVKEERAAYNMTIDRIDSEKGEVHVRVYEIDNSSEVVLKRNGDTVRKGRFEVKGVMGNYVRFEDRQRKTNESPRSFRLFVDGTITVP